MNWKDLEKKSVFVQLKSGRFYTGKIIEVADTGSNTIFITLIDKFNKQVVFLNTEIEVIEEEGDKELKNAK